MSDIIEDIFGPDSTTSNYEVNIEEISASRTQAATTASQTLEIARAVIAEHNTDELAHRNIELTKAGTNQPGVVIIDSNLNEPSDEFFAVPNSSAVVNYIAEAVAAAITYAGQITIGSVDISSGVLPITGAIKKGSLYIFSGTGSLEYNGHTYSAEDFVIANKKITAAEAKSLTSFDWFNVQDTDVVKLDKTQTLTHKNLADITNTYRSATTEQEGAVKIATSITQTDTTAVPNAVLVNTELNKRLRSNERQLNDGSWAYKAFTDELTAESNPDTKTVVNLNSVKYYDANDNLVRTVNMPTDESNGAPLSTTEFLATTTYVDNKDVSDFLKENKPVAEPSFVNGQFVILNNANVEVETVSSNSTVGIEDGYTGRFTGQWKWVASDTKSNPERWTSTNFTFNTIIDEDDYNDVPASDNPYPSILQLGAANPIRFDSAIKTGTIRTYSPKCGLVVEGTNVVVADGENVSNGSTIGISFYRYLYYGYYVGDLPVGTGAENASLIMNDNSFKLGKTRLNSTSISNFTMLGSTVKPIGMTDEEYNRAYLYVIYPQNVGSIKLAQDANKFDITSSFISQGFIDFVNSSGKNIPMRVYKFSNAGTPGPWTIVSTNNDGKAIY